jgi:hypothetical protein
MATLLVCKIIEKYPGIKKDDYRKMKNPCQARVFTLLSVENLYGPGCLALGDVLWSVHGKDRNNTRLSSWFINNSI